jgi:O-antigen ligase
VSRLATVFPQIDTDILATVCLVGLIAVATNTGPAQMRNRWVRLVLAGIYLLELYETRTRTALVLTALALFIVTFAWARRSAIAIPTIAFCAAAVVILLVVGGAAVSSYFYRQQNASVFSTLTGRTVEWSQDVTLWKTSPIVGLGYYSGHREGLLEASLIVPGQPAHSNLDETWLETLVDTGVVGCVLLAAFALAGMARLVRYRRLLPMNIRWCVLAVGVFALPITSFVNPTIQANISPNFAIWAFLLLVLPTGAQPRNTLKVPARWSHPGSAGNLAVNETTVSDKRAGTTSGRVLPSYPTEVRIEMVRPIREESDCQSDARSRPCTTRYSRLRRGDSVEGQCRRARPRLDSWVMTWAWITKQASSRLTTS